MQILDFIEKTDLSKQNECEKAKLLCFYHYKETGTTVFSMTLISELMINSGYNAPNTSRLKDKLTSGKNKAFLKSKGNAPTIEFVPAIFQSLEKTIGAFWTDTTTIESCSELLDETKFCGYRNYLDRLIYQINHSYASNCYDAAAVLMRRLFEVLLILSYQYLGIDNDDQLNMDINIPEPTVSGKNYGYSIVFRKDGLYHSEGIVGKLEKD